MHKHTHILQPHTAGYFQPQGVLASVVIAEGWDQDQLFVFPVSASEVCVSVSTYVSLGLRPQIPLYLRLCLALPFL